MNYKGRELDPVALWGKFVDFPASMPDSGFAPLTVCPNPNHHTDKRHFQINLDRPLVHCFAGCGISGTYEHALAIVQGWVKQDGKPDIKRARKEILRNSKLALGTGSKRKVRDPSRRRRVRHVSDGAEIPSLAYDTYIPAVGLEYLAARGIGTEGVARFNLGWDAEERRLVIPARDERGYVRFLIKRATREKDWPKYLYTEDAEKTALLYGVCELDLKLVSSRGLALVEGSLDTIKMQVNGMPTGGILGSRLSFRQTEIISRLRPPRVFTFFDRDAAGVHATEAAARRLTKVPMFVCLYPKGKNDPAELTRKEVDRAIESAIPFAEFARRLKRHRRPGRTTERSAEWQRA